MEILDKILVNIPMIALIISLFALGISFLQLYFNFLKSGKIIASFEKIQIYVMCSNNDGKVTSRVFIPIFTLFNIGARPLLLVDIRLKLINSKIERPFYLSTEIPSESIYSPSFHDYGRLHSGYEFKPFMLNRKSMWENNFSLGILLTESNELKNDIEFQLDVFHDNKWETICNQIFSFGSFPIHLQPVPSVSINLVRTADWNRRRNTL